MDISGTSDPYVKVLNILSESFGAEINMLNRFIFSLTRTKSLKQKFTGKR